MMNSYALKLLFLMLANMSVYCMKDEDAAAVIVKLDDESVWAIPSYIAQKSNFIYEKQALKERLAIDPARPIVVRNMSSDSFNFFTLAADKTEENFNDFFLKLKKNQQQNLISAAGQTVLNSPGITAFIVQAYLPGDIAHVIMKQVTHGLEHYVRCAMIAKNGVHHIVHEGQDVQHQKTIMHSNGFMHTIPQQFESNGALCTTNSTLARASEERDVFFYACKKINSYAYAVIEPYSDDNNMQKKYIECINKKGAEKKELSIREILCKAIFSPDGKYIALSFFSKKNSLLLLSIGSSSENVIKEEIYFSDCFDVPVDMQFHPQSAILYALFSDQIDNKSQLLLYDIVKSNTIVNDFDCAVFVPLAFNHDFTRMIVAEAYDDNEAHANKDVLSVWDMSNINDIKLLHKIEGPQDRYAVVAHYNNHSNDAAVQFSNGDIFFIHEAADGTIASHDKKFPLHENLSALGLKIFRASLLFTSDDDFLINHCNFTQNVAELEGPESDEQPLVTLWSTKTKSMIVKHRTPLLKNEFPEIIMASHGCSFISNHFLKEEGRMIYSAWGECKLYEPEEDMACASIDADSSSLFAAYVLYRVCCAHKNQEDLVLHKGGAVERCIQAFPVQLKQCIDKYLTVKK